MFQRFTEKARRVIFFARYEAGQYGSPYIEPEHLLLGFLREDRALVKRFLGGGEAETTIRAEVEKHIPRRERIATSVEVPLTGDSKRVLHLASEEADRLGHPHVGTEHLLLGLLQVEGSLATQILQARGLKLVTFREELSKFEGPALTAGKRPAEKVALLRLESFLSGLKWQSVDELTPFFAENATLIDVFGKRWDGEGISKNFEALFAPYAKKNAAYTVEGTLAETSEVFVAMVLWKNAILASMERVWMHRMSIVLVREAEDWAIALVHVTSVKPS